MYPEIDVSRTEQMRANLVDFLDRHKCRLSVHEPDEEGVTGTVTGNHLDNAFGNSTDHNELVLTLTSAKETLRVNLADLLALATYQYRGPYGGVKVVECDDEQLSRDQQAVALHSDFIECPNCQKPLIELRQEQDGESMIFAYYECPECEKRFRFDFTPVGIRSLG